MGRRRKKESLVETLMFLPWWIGVGLGMSAFIGLRWLPSMLPPMLKGLAPVMQMFSWVVLALFGVPGLISLVRAKMKPASDASSLPSTPTSSSPAQRRTQALATEPQAKAIESWTVEALRELEWKRFELRSTTKPSASNLRHRVVARTAASMSSSTGWTPPNRSPSSSARLGASQSASRKCASCWA